MTSIRPDQTIENVQKLAHRHKHSIVLQNTRDDSDYWQKIWLIERFVRGMGFVKVRKK